MPAGESAGDARSYTSAPAWPIARVSEKFADGRSALCYPLSGRCERIPLIARSRSIGVEQAHRTLRRGTVFLGTGPGRGGWAGSPLQAKVLGNGLRELDRFLSVLLDELAHASGFDELEIGRLTRTRNTASKLAILCERLGLPRPDLARWRALGRCRDCLFYTRGVVRRADVRSGRVMTLGWPGKRGGAGGGDLVALGEPLTIADDDLAWICDFYDRIAAELVAISASLSSGQAEMIAIE